MEQVVEIQIGSEEAAMPVPFENAQGAIGNPRGHVPPFAHRRYEVVLIGGEEQCGDPQRMQQRPDVVGGEYAQAVSIPLARGTPSEQQESLDLLGVRMRRVQSGRGERAYPLHGAPWHETHGHEREMELGAWGDAGKRVENDQLTYPLRVRDGERHGECAAERFTDHHDGRAIRHRDVEMMRKVGHQRCHGRRVVAQSIREYAITVMQYACLPVEQQPRAIEPGHINQRRAGPRCVQSCSRVDLGRLRDMMLGEK